MAKPAAEHQAALISQHYDLTFRHHCLRLLRYELQVRSLFGCFHRILELHLVQLKQTSPLLLKEIVNLLSRRAQREENFEFAFQARAAQRKF